MGEYRIRSAAVLGAGVMGSKIAAHVANAGIPTCLLDIALGCCARCVFLPPRLESRDEDAGHGGESQHRPRDVDFEDVFREQEQQGHEGAGQQGSPVLP